VAITHGHVLQAGEPITSARAAMILLHAAVRRTTS
jgi:hypothetical protein